MLTARALVVLGTGSHVGKSVLVTALCRIFSRAGYRVRPFKAQNMALNSFVTPEGGEVGMAQAVQAEACGVPPSVEMNPILLKPSSDRECQVILRGRPIGHMEARTYWSRRRELFPVVAEALVRLRAEADLVVIEGAGSPVEVNLKEWDITNQMLGERIEDPDGVEPPCSETVGLGLLPVQSRFFGEKETHQVEARGAGGPFPLSAVGSGRLNSS